MMRVALGLVAFLLGIALIASPAMSQPPEGKGDKGDKGDKGEKGGKGGPPRFELGQVLPPPLIEELNLTAAQQKELEVISKDLRTKLDKLLTADQKKTVENFRPRGGPGGRGGDRGGKDASKGGKGDKDTPKGDKGAPKGDKADKDE